LTKVRRINNGSIFTISRFDEGGFGTLYRSTRLHNRQTLPLVVKLLHSSQASDRGSRAIADLHKAIKDKAATFPSGWETLLRGLPFWVGEVKFQNKLTIALISLDLEPLGFAQFQHVLEANRKRYCSLDLGKRVKLARSFAMGTRSLRN